MYRDLRCWKCKAPILSSDGVICPKCLRNQQDNVMEIDLDELERLLKNKD